MNYSRIFKATKRQFDTVIQKEGITVADYYDKDKTYTVFFRKDKRGVNPQGKLNLFYCQDAGIGMGTVFTFHGNTYIVTTQDAVESDIYCSSMAERCGTVLTVSFNDGYASVPFAVKTNEYSIIDAGEITMVSGSVIIYTGLNDRSRNIKINTRFFCFGGYYRVSNLFYNNGIAYFYLERMASPEDNYVLQYTGKTVLNLSDVTYKLEYAALLNGNIIENPKLSYSVDHEETATVGDDGVLTMLQSGDVIVTARWEDGDGTLCIVQITINDEEPGPAEKGTSSISGNQQLKIGFARNYIAHFYSTDGYEVSGIVPVWTVSDCGFEQDIEKTETGSSISLKIDESRTDLIGQTLTLNLADSEGKFAPSKLEITVKEWW